MRILHGPPVLAAMPQAAMSCELPSIFSREHPTARKPHKCCECHGVIRQGETYHRFWGIWDDPATFKVCDDCEALRAEIDKGSDPDEVTPYGYLCESVFEYRDGPIARYIAIRRKRGAPIPDWMLKAEREAKP